MNDIAPAIIRIIRSSRTGFYCGTVSSLRAALKQRDPYMPLPRPAQIGRLLREAEAELAEAGLVVDYLRTRTQRTINIRPKERDELTEWEIEQHERARQENDPRPKLTPLSTPGGRLRERRGRGW